MKKLNKKGVTLVELIVSFALVAVAVGYFFQTLYTVKKIYNKSQKETQEFVDKNYALRIVDAYIDKKGTVDLGGVCTTYDLCSSIEIDNEIDNGTPNIYKITIQMKNGDNVVLNKYHKEN